MSRNKTEYLRVGGVDDGEELKLQGEKVKRAKNFKYVGSTVSSNGRCEEEVRRRIQEGWRSWRKVSGVLCDRKLSENFKTPFLRRRSLLCLLSPVVRVKLRKYSINLMLKVYNAKSLY